MGKLAKKSQTTLPELWKSTKVLHKVGNVYFKNNGIPALTAFCMF